MMVKVRFLTLFLLLFAVAVGCKKNGDHNGPAPSSALIHTDGRWFKDAQGRVVILRGISAQNATTEEDWDNLHSWGVNVVRLLINWEGIEPEKGQFSDDFFEHIDQQATWAEERGIFFFLDMHQDLYGPAFGGDGAPRWASRTDIPFSFNNPWGLNYFSIAVMTSFDDFFASAELQDHFAEAWLRAVNRYKDRPNILGYDLYNEPSFGSRAAWIFERDYLGPFQDRLAARIRAVDPDHIIFYETTMYCSGGMPSFLPPPAVKNNVAIAPHFYDPTLGFTHMNTYDGNYSRMEAMMKLRTKESKGLGDIPWLLGEFGIDSGPNSDQYLRDIYNMFDKYMASGCYWCYGRGGMGPLDDAGNERPRVLDVARPRPMRIAGEPLSYSFDQATKILTLQYQERPNVTGPTEIFVPESRYYPTGIIVESDDTYWQHEYDGRILKIYADPNRYTHTITVKPKP